MTETNEAGADGAAERASIPSLGELTRASARERGMISDSPSGQEAGDGAADKGSPVRVGRPVTMDDTRNMIAYFLLWALLGLIIVEVLFGGVYSAWCWYDVGTCPAATSALGVLTTPLTSMFTAMIGLVGSVVGFYFGSKSN